MNPWITRLLPTWLRGWSKNEAAGNGRKALGEMLHSGSSMLSFFGTSGTLLPGTKYDHAREVGDGLGSSVLAAPLNWVMRNFIQATPIVEQAKAEEWHVITNHPLIALLRHPNEFYGPRVLWMATVLDFSFGNAYWLKIRNTVGQVVQLWWVPASLVIPRWPTDGKTFISHYDYQSAAGSVRLETQDVVHFRFGLDPRNHRLGLSQLGALMREVFTDDQAANFMGAVLRNLGVIGIVISPKEQQKIDAEDVKELKKYLGENFTGDKRGETFISSLPIDIELLQYNLQGFDISPIRDVSEERVCAAMGLPASVVGFGTGLHQTKVGAPQPLSARLWSPTGPTTMGAVNVGDMIAIPNGWGRVSGVYPQGEQGIYRVTFQDGATAESTADHLWQVRAPNEDWKVLPLSAVAKWSWWKMRRTVVPLQGVTEFAEQPAMIPPYVMGLLLADGTLGPRNLQFTSVKPDVVERIEAEVGAGYAVHQTESEGIDYRIAFREAAKGRGPGGGTGAVNPFKDELRRLRLWGRKAPEKFVPNEYKYTSARARRQLLQGILDGDGYVNVHGQPAIEQTSTRLADDITEIVQSLGGYTLRSAKRANRAVRFIKGRPFRSRHDRVHLSIVIDDAASLFATPAKRDRCRVRGKAPTRKFRRVEFVRREEAQCIAVDGSLYLTDNFLVTHNTMKENRRMAWTDCIIPNQQIIADELERSLLVEFLTGSAVERVRFDTTHVPALWEDQNEKHDRVRADFLSSMITRGEARRETGRPADASHDVYVQPVNLIQLGSQTRVDDPQPVVADEDG